MVLEAVDDNDDDVEDDVDDEDGDGEDDGDAGIIADANKLSGRRILFSFCVSKCSLH